MIDQLLPRHIDNTYRGYRLALWLFGLLVFMKVAMSVKAYRYRYRAEAVFRCR